MSKPEITEDIKNDLQMLKYRSVLDNKTFMKGSDRRGHKYFQIGTIMDSAEVSLETPKKETIYCLGLLLIAINKETKRKRIG